MQVGLPTSWCPGQSLQPKMLFEYPAAGKYYKDFCSALLMSFSLLSASVDIANFCFPNGIDESQIGRSANFYQHSERVFVWLHSLLCDSAADAAYYFTFQISLEKLESPEHSFSFLIYSSEKVRSVFC
jgi:hypothetical protein